MKFLAQSFFEYDARGNLVAEHQGHGAVAVQGTTPRVGYTWEFKGVDEGNYDWLTAISYPQRLDGTSHGITFEYSGGNGIDSGMGRVSSINLDALGSVASYEYAGSSRRVSTTWGNGVSQSFGGVIPIGGGSGGGDPAGGYLGLDRFGRVKDLHFQNSGGTIHQYQYGYNLAGNRTFARVTQATDLGGTAHVNDRSWLYAYDRLNRLSDAMMGQLTEDNQGIAYGQGVPAPTRTTWNLDNLGNWSGGGAGHDSVVTSVDSDGDGAFEPVRSLHHDVNGANEITAAWNDMSPVDYRYDAAGNLVYDGSYYYQYDAWNRLIQVNLLGTAGIAADGRLVLIPAEGKTLGELVCRYAYDAVGRLMWKRTPTNEGLTALQRKDYYYDGVRRIQENITRPTLLMPEAGGSGGGGPPQELELPSGPGNDELPVPVSGGGGQQIIGPPTVMCEEPPLPVGTLYWTDREYVYGPGYVDEFILQIDQDGVLLYMLQDANYNVVALVAGGWSGISESGVPPTLVPTPGTLLEQYAYDPYGTVIAADNLDVDQYGVSRHAVNRVGFQGLFFERYDGEYTLPSIAPNVSGMYYARNRFYSPALGRFLQRDPNETGIPIIAALVMNGEAAAILFGGFDTQSLYGDGMNLYLFVGNNPLSRVDPLGLDPSLTLTGQLVVGGILGDLAAAGIATAITAGVIAAALLLDAAIEQTIDALRVDRGQCRLIRKEHSGVIHADRHYWDCVYQCPGINREYILPGTTSVLYECPEFIPNPFR